MKGVLVKPIHRKELKLRIDNLPDTVFFWEIKKKVGLRSINQNRWYFAHIRLAAEDIDGPYRLNESTDALHEELKLKFCPIKRIQLNKREVEVQSTKHLTPDEFKVYHLEVVLPHLMATTQVPHFPFPDEPNFPEFMHIYKHERGED